MCPPGRGSFAARPRRSSGASPQNQAFRDGNKRTAVVLLRAFLNLNGYDFALPEDLYDLAMGVADSSLTVDGIETRLRPHSYAV